MAIDKSIYARPGGKHWHSELNCALLRYYQFDKFGYEEIAQQDVKQRKLRPCSCTLPLRIVRVGDFLKSLVLTIKIRR